ncbi:uncharacterized protein FIBRA_02494 [Fibroporia radiculosa]|uniref:EXPERA domain-containing protein n=1 Tax=Fibroporia radiculosa TaxID=599839 RepID=J4I933_9APHY|nr:uncharacterized protein FIBRA_02494 [Fibroporia radiculosa]CCM00461.1 predicted protein [Fibroporia radiculosa]
MFGAVFSASYSDKFEMHQLQEATRERPTAHWRRGYQQGSATAGMCYYLEYDGPIPGSPPTPGTSAQGSSCSSRSSPAPRHDDLQPERREHIERVPAQPTTAGSHALSGYVRRLRVALPHFSSLLPSRRTRTATRTAMAVRTHLLVSLWFALTIPVIFWDATYLFLRPRSMVGGDLHHFWKPYALYQEVDYIYGVKAYEEGDGFPNAQSLLNIVENLMNIAYLYLAHVKGSSIAPLVGFASAVMTLSKTILYWLQEYYCNGCSVGHNSLQDLIVLWVIPNGLWLLVPSIIIWRLGKDISGALRLADRAAKKELSGKKQ